ncbi:DUF6503 family protein [Aquimarina brevivitae]|uniref:Deoxyribose-phosphate aldolase n=1 Tax=Aquimarina brevivitae TaxID=323412 RepID=A0A4Q7NZ12_9FLAO|nr:DUF6503 family protein [Aquimarina brevivitae]RZS92585.1 hypothetical protein EV197_2723 [Aquimarina brevivitae]
MKTILKSHCYFTIILLLSFCKIQSQETAEQIVNKAIEVAGGELFDQATIRFTFRDKEYVSRRNTKGVFSLERITYKENKTIRDVLNNRGFQRTINNCPVNTPDSLLTKMSDGVNSVHYFAYLPYGLNAAAVIKKKIGEDLIKDEPYHKIQVTFKKEGGGTDYEDEFVYWIHKEKYTIDYLAYKYAVNGGGIRFREAYNPRVINGIRFVDYHNFKVDELSTPLKDLGKLFERKQLKKVSTIDLENIYVYFNLDCC